jgi:hypothetical protein
MMSMMSVTMAAAIGAVVSVPMFQLTLAQTQSRAALEARVLWQSEIERARQIWSIDYNDFDLVELSNASKCVKGPQHAYTDDGFMFDVQCTVGRQTVGNNAALLPYPAASRNPGQFTDDDNDGFEDVTGLPTHYDQCYSGWKGDGFKESTCTLGGEFVIPMYADLYS